jgi:hypothetical protein
MAAFALLTRDGSLASLVDGNTQSTYGSRELVFSPQWRQSNERQRVIRSGERSEPGLPERERGRPGESRPVRAERAATKSRHPQIVRIKLVLTNKDNLRTRRNRRTTHLCKRR